MKLKYLIPALPLLLLLYAGQVRATPTPTATPTPCGSLVQNPYGNTTSCSANFPATSFTPSMGDLLVVNINTSGTGATPNSLSVTDIQGNVWMPHPQNSNASVCSSTTPSCLAQFAAIAKAGTADVVTVHIGSAGSGGCGGIVSVDDFTGNAAYARFDVSNWGVSGYNTVEQTGLTPTTNNATEIAVGMIGAVGNAVSTTTGPTQYGTALGGVSTIQNLQVVVPYTT